MKLETVKLPRDGASYTCSYTIADSEGIHECQRTTTTGLTQESYDKALPMKPTGPGFSILFMRALCPEHISIIESWFD